jgi:hypothetical protein
MTHAHFSNGSNALIDGKNIGDALGGGAATATFGASIGTMLDTQTGSGTYTVGLNRKQVAVVHLVDFGGAKTIERFFTVDFYYGTEKVGDVELSLTFNVAKQGNRISIKELSRAKGYARLGGLYASLGEAEAEESHDIHIAREGQIEVSMVFIGVSVQTGNENSFAFSLGKGPVEGQYNYTHTQSYQTTPHSYRLHTMLYFNADNSKYMGNSYRYQIDYTTNFPLLFSGGVFGGTYYKLQFNPEGLFEDRRW